MPRPGRFTYPHAVHHVTLRCNHREFLFEPASFELFVCLLQETRRRCPLSLFHYCLMTNRLHLFLQVGFADTLWRAMDWLSTTFLGRFNRARGRVGRLWQGRFRSTLVESVSAGRVRASHGNSTARVNCCRMVNGTMLLRLPLPLPRRRP